MKFSLLFLLLAFTVPMAAVAQESAAAPVPAKASGTPVEQLIATFTKARLNGRWNAIKDGKLGPEKADQYVVDSLENVSGKQWVLKARVTYKGESVVVPVPLEVEWAGDVAVLVLKDVSFGGAKKYSARVMVHGNTYAGTWSGGDYGGVINGLIEHE